MVVEMVQLQHYDGSANSPAVMSQSSLRQINRETTTWATKDMLNRELLWQCLYKTTKYIIFFTHMQTYCEPLLTQL